jgi:hypothetical protein
MPKKSPKNQGAALVYSKAVKWSRRLSAITVNLLLVNWFVFGVAPTNQLTQWLSPILVQLEPIPRGRVVAALLVLWYAFLTQLKIRWALWLPIYLVIFPALRIFWKIFKYAAGTLADQTRSLGEAGTATLPQKTAKTKRSFPVKQVWLVLFFAGLVAFFGLNMAWTTWILVALTVPIWLYLLKSAYNAAIIPRTLANVAAKFCTVTLDNQIKTFNEAKEKKQPTPPATITYRLVNPVLQRYSEEQIASVVQRESLAAFFGSLLIALAVSCCFWGLVGFAVMQTNNHSLDAYEFFNSGTFGEAVLWAWGCMTTTVDFPGRMAPIWLKWLHAGILATGLFQLTFLLACFSVMINAESQRTIQDANKGFEDARTKIEQTRSLEASVILLPMPSDESRATDEED